MPRAGPPVTREAWLHQAVETFRPRFEAIGMPLPDRVHVSVGFGYGARRENAVILGQCWARRASADGVNHIFVSPQQDNPPAMLVTLLHELIHAADGGAHGHKGPFAQAAAAVGFQPPMTITPTAAALAGEMTALAEALGPLPHAKLTPVTIAAPPPTPTPTAGGGTVPIHSGPGTQGTRLVKLTAAGCCGYTVRTTAKWLAQGNPLCPHGAAMTRPDGV